MSRFAEERGLIGGFFIKTAIVLAILGLVAIEGGSILFTRFQIEDLADSAATAAAATLDRTGDIEAARQEAIRIVDTRDPEARLSAFEALANDTVRVTVVKRAGTLVVHRIGFLRGLGRIRATAEGRPSEF